ncbi:S-adenosyl-L-methionine-dependent methyltransferase [Dunaliella salina]|uniref:Leucine carboxyl methyltransferase 1 homolog n=1 Tax=Dunaliella salina TaxID=3046 RepID=A0ABQ7GB76_DUNSA|nr:S-adenosyl-L-methionine-dependent methyltransferase [Dunaliella salina]|eukprot:KAF5831853.1 S-adenosyl-L-methionine-dependent methyltransferase [Dunaliella salina]
MMMPNSASLSCAKLGYFRDDFIQFFVKKKTVRRSPLINRGYYSRYAGLRMLQQKFLHASNALGMPAQFLILGAGFDTTWFQLASEGQAPAKCLELDFAEVTKRKAAIIASNPPLMDLLHMQAGGIQAGGQGNSGASPPSGSQETVQLLPVQGEVLCGDGAYSLLPADLRDLQAVKSAIQRAGLDTSAPTLILSECVLVYMEPSDSSNLVRMLGQTFSNAAIVVYEQVRPHDAFGRQMRSNLEERGCPLLGLTSTPTLEAHCE